MKRKKIEVSEDQEEEDCGVKKIKAEDSSKSQNSQSFVKNFRLKLKKGDFHDDLKYFLKQAEKSNKLLDLYIKSGGKVLEVVEAIKSNEDSNLEICSSLYKLLRHVIFEIIKTKEENLSPTIQALHYLINRNKTSINNMLKSSNPEDKILILKILSISITLEGELGQEILKSVDVFTVANEKEDYSILVDSAKDTIYEDSLRLAFIHFYVAFLIDDTNMTIRKRILRKSKLFELFVKDLQHDSMGVIKIVFTNLTKNILISPAFSKPEKLKIFSENVIKSLLQVYDWEGPKNSLAGKAKEEDKETVVGIVHEFLLLFLSSKKHGIVFKALTEKSQNLRQSQVISYFKRFWLQEKPSELIIEIVKSCPELMQNLLTILVFPLKPQVNTNWFLCINFVMRLITELEPAQMIHHIKKLEPKKISSNIIKLSISQFFLQNIDMHALISMHNLAVRENCVHLLRIMLEQCCKYLQEVNNLEHLKHFEIHRIKFDVINHIFSFYPKLDLILNSLYRSINQTKNSIDSEDKNCVKNQLKHTLEILLLTIKNFPSIIDKTPSIIAYLEFLRPVYEFNVDEDENIDQNDSLEIEMKVIEIILCLEPSILSIDSENLDKIFHTLVQIYCFSKNRIYKTEAKFLLTVILNNLDLFAGKNSMEIDFWMESFRFVRKSEMKNCCAAFVKTLRDVKVDCSMEIDKSLGKIEIFEEIDAENVEENSEEVIIGELLVFQKFLMNQPNKKLKKFLEFIEVVSLFLYQHSNENSKAILEVLESEKVAELNLSIVGYMKKQSKKKSSIVKISNYGTHFNDCLLGKLNERITTDSFNVEEILTNQESEEELMILMVQMIFYAKIDPNNDKIVENMEVLYKKLVELESLKVSRKFEALEENPPKIKDLQSIKNSDKILNFVFNEKSAFLTNLNLDSHNSSTNFIANLAKIFNKHQNFLEISQKFREKLVFEVKELLKGKNFKNSEEILCLMENFELSGSDCLEVFEELGDFAAIPLVIFCLKRLKKLKMDPLNKQQIQSLEKFYLKALKKESSNLGEFEESLCEYLQAFCHNIDDFSSKIFEICFEESDELKVKLTSKSFIKLATFLFERNEKFDEIFLQNLKAKNPIYKDKKELFYPLLNVAFSKPNLKMSESETLKFIYQEYKNGIVKSIEKPNKAAQIYKENLESDLKIIEICMPINECQDLSLKKYKFDSTEIFQLKMMEKIFHKTVENSKKTETFGEICLNFINNWLQMFQIMIGKKENFEVQYLEVLENFCRRFKELKLEEPVVLEHLSEYDWENFYKSCLKYGLKLRENIEFSKLLVVLGKFIDILVPNNSENEEIPKIFDMIVTHSNFFNVAFSFKPLEIKKNLYFLLNVLVQKNKSVASEKHVPIFLSSYHATMSTADQLILNLLRFYELECNIDLNEFRPMLFGATALNFYSDEYKEFSSAKKTVENMIVLTGNLLNSFEKSIVENTLNNYPISREMKILTIQDIEESLLNDRLAENNVYDPAYFLPLFDLIFTTSTYNFYSVVLKNNLLALIWPALSCENEKFRLIAAHSLLKLREVDESRKSHTEMWIRLYDSVQLGFGELLENNTKKCFPRPASISTQCLAEISITLTDKLHDLYKIVSDYLIVMKKFQFYTIPEYIVLFHSSDPKHTEHREFLLNMIYHGIKDHLDLKLLNNTPLLKMLLSCYNCPLADRKSNEMILKILNKLIVKTGKLDFLIKMFGIVPWLYQVIANLEAFEYDTVDLLLEMLKNLNSKLNENSEFTNEEKSNLKGKLLELLLKLLPKFTKSKISIKSFSNFLETVVEINQFEKISDFEVTSIFELLQVFADDAQNTLEFFYIQNYPNSVKFLESNEKYSNNLQHLNLGHELTAVLLNCRTVFMKFYGKA